MLHADDMLTTRWQRWHRRVMALNLDALLRWSLIANMAAMTLVTVLGVLAFLWATGSSLVASIVGLF